MSCRKSITEALFHGSVSVRDDRSSKAQQSGIRVFPQIRSFLIDELNEASPKPTFFFDVYFEAVGRELPQDWEHISPLKAAKRLWLGPPSILELYEPMWKMWAWFVLALTYKLRTRGRGKVMFYAIDNNDVRNVQGRRLAWFRRLLVPLRRLVCAWLISPLFDRVAFGTDAAAECYADLYRLPTDTTIVPALRAERDRGGVKVPLSACFLGEIGDRKGISLLMAAWEETERLVGAATLTVIGTGPLERRVADWCDQKPSSRRLLGQLPRHAALAQLSATSVVVLPSQPWPGWREQIGLSIVEGLSAGCTVVATSETGMAAWLARHGHSVVDSSCSAVTLGGKLGEALLHPIDPQIVLSALPGEDGRIEADRWLYRDLDETISAAF